MKIIIVGSMKFHDLYENIKWQIESSGHEAIIPLLDESYPDSANIKREAMQDFNDNLKKFDAILVANFNKDNKPSHIGVNTLMEIGMAFILNKKIFILNDIPDHCSDELTAINAIPLKGNLINIK